MLEITPDAGPPRGYRLIAEQSLAADRDELFAFFSDAMNLERITPPWMSFHVVTPGPIEIEQGTRIDYKLRMRGVPLRWRSEITRWEPPHRFVDQQLFGPYRRWHHLHEFEEADGHTICRDEIHYAVPGGALVHRLLVKRDLQRIFAYRQTVLEELFRERANR